MSHPTGTVCRVIAIGAFLGVFVVQLPVLAVLAVGLVLLTSSGSRLPGRVGVLARAGFAVLMVEAVASLAWAGFLPQLVGGLNGVGYSTFGLVSAAIGFLLAVLTATGLGLVVAAVLAARQRDYASDR